MGVRVTRPAHEGDGGDERPMTVMPDDLLGPEAVLDGHDRRAVEAAFEGGGRRLEPGGLRGHDAEVELRQLVRIGRGGERGVEVAATRDAQAVAFQRLGVVVTAGEDADLGNLREMGGEKASDDAGSHDADPLDHPAEATAGSRSAAARRRRRGASARTARRVR